MINQVNIVYWRDLHFAFDGTGYSTVQYWGGCSEDREDFFRVQNFHIHGLHSSRVDGDYWRVVFHYVAYLILGKIINAKRPEVIQHKTT